MALSGCTNALGTTLQQYPSLLQPTPSAAVGGTVSSDVRCGLVGPIVKVLLDANAASIFAASPPAGSSYAFTLARNEYESIQVICRSASTRVTGVSLSVVLSTEARAAGIVQLPHSTRNYVVTTVSDCSGAHGSTPDILVPFVDPWYNQTRLRHAVLPVGEAVGWWLDVFAPPSAPAASYTGIVTVAATGLRSPITLPFTFRVRNLTLPDVSPYASAFLYWGAPGSSSSWDMRATMELGLMHRISTPSMLRWSSEMTDPPQWTSFAANWGKYVLGGAMPFGLANTSLTALAMTMGYCITYSAASCTAASHAKTSAVWGNIYDWFKAHGVAHLLFDYTYDEPQDEVAWTELRTRAGIVRRAASGLRPMCTTSLSNGRAHGVGDLVQLWAPIINELSVTRCGSTRNTYATANISARNVWAYQSCSSHGCGAGGCTDPAAGGGATPLRGTQGWWPSYMIDFSMVRNRIYPWVTWLYGLGGELYWSLSYASAMGRDEWTDQFVAGGNGDGTLTYRGTAVKIGGMSEVPLASVRLKAIRDGQEDLMYLALAEARVGRAEVEAIISGLITSANSWADDAATMAVTREAIGDLAEFGVLATPMRVKDPTGRGGV